jgi:hypothetical protein
VVYDCELAFVAVMLFEAALSGLVPFVPVALTLKVYEVASVNPLTVKGEDAPDTVIQPGVEMAVYEDIPEGNLPVQAGAVNATEAQRLFPAVAVPIVGAPGAAGQMF